MHLKGFHLIIILNLLVFGFSWRSVSAADFEPLVETGCDKAIEIEIEDLSPIHPSRQIDTTSIHVLWEMTSAPDDPWSFYYGLTLTNTSGYVNFYRPKRDCTAVGLGPVFLVRYEPLHREKLSIAIDMSGGLIFYSEDFPAGGDFYNFMWRLGPQVVYRFNNRTAVSFGYKWMHVSNGQHEHNPAYDAEGFSLGAIVKF